MIDYKYKDLFWQSSMDKQWRIEFDGGVICNEDLFSQSIELTETLCSESQLRFGCCEASVFKFKVANIVKPLLNEWLTVSAVIECHYDAPLMIGRYKVVSDQQTADRRHREIVAYDAMQDILNADVAAWYNSILPETNSFMTLKQFRDSFFAQFALDQIETEGGLINDNMRIERTIEPEQLSGKDVITAICELNGCFGHIGRDGKFHYIYLTQDIMGLYPSNTLYPDCAPEYLPQADTGGLYPQQPKSERITTGLFISCQFEDFICKKIDQLQIRQKENEIGQIWPIREITPNDNCYVIEDNFLVYGKSSSQLRMIAKNIYEKIENVLYRPFDCEAIGNPCLELGDSVRILTKYEIVESYVLERTLKGIQALRDSYKTSGTEKYGQKVNGVHNSIVQLKGKTNTLQRNIEETKSTIADVEQGLRSEISQTAREIKATVANHSNEWLEGDIKIDLYGYGLPQDNYSADKERSGKNYLDRNTGKYYQCRESGNSDHTFEWQYLGSLEKAETALQSQISLTKDQILQSVSENYQTLEDMGNYPKTLEVESKIKQTSDSIVSTVSKSQRLWDVSEYDETKLLYGYGPPNNQLYNPAQNADKKYLDQSGGKIYFVVNGAWIAKKQLALLTQKLNSKIDQTESGIISEVSKSRAVWDVTDVQFDLCGWGHPEKHFNALDYQFKYYLDQSSGKIYESMPFTPHEFIWEFKRQLEKKSADFSTNITQLSDEINLKVHAGDVSNQLSIEENGVFINSNRLHINSDNFKLQGSGEIEATGTIKTGQEERYAILNKSGLDFYYQDTIVGDIGADGATGSGTGMSLATEKNYILFGIRSTPYSTTIKYMMNNGVVDAPARHEFRDNVRMNSLYMTNKINFGESSYLKETSFAGMEVITIKADAVQIDGDLEVLGSQKNRVVQTENYGNVKMNAFETADAYFSDIGSGKIKDGACYVYFDPVFAETIELDAEYQVFLTRTSKEKTEYVEKKCGYFIVYGEENATFDWMITAKQKDCKTIRMEKNENKEQEEIPYNMSVFYGEEIAPVQSESYSIELDADLEKEASVYLNDYHKEQQRIIEMEDLT